MALLSLTDQQRRLSNDTGYLIDLKHETKWMRNGRSWIGPDPATDCEMRLWKTLEGYDRKINKPVLKTRTTGRRHVPVGVETTGRIEIKRSSTFGNIDCLDICGRTATLLYRHGISTLDLLTAMTARSLLRLPGFGVKSIEEIQDALEGQGLTLSS